MLQRLEAVEHEQGALRGDELRQPPAAVVGRTGLRITVA